MDNLYRTPFLLIVWKGLNDPCLWAHKTLCPPYPNLPYSSHCILVCASLYLFPISDLESLMNRNSSSFISVAVTNTLTKSKARKEGIYLDYNSRLQLVIWEKSSQEFKKLHIIPIVKSTGKQMDPCSLDAYTPLALLSHGLGASLGNDSAHGGLGLHTSMSNKDNPHRYAHRLIWSRLLPLNTLFPGESRLCQTER